MSASKAEFVIFYAWQSDRPGGRNRYFIQEAAAEAAAQMNADPACPYSVRIDQDTQGVPGLCDIPATILGKIDAADAFLCDLTYVAKSEVETDVESDSQPRLCSNPNILFELGYAFHVMGAERILCVMNEHYGPVADQIFDLAHRRFPLAYRLPDEALSRKEVAAGLADSLAFAVRALLPMGRRADIHAVDRVAAIRREHESRVRTGAFHGLVRRVGAIALAVIPAQATQISHDELRLQHIPPPGRIGWNPAIRGNSAISLGEMDDERCSIAEMRTDGVILGADAWVLDPAFHPSKESFVPSSATESVIISAAAKYLEALHKLNAPLPWTICVSLLEVKNYCLYVSDAQTNCQPFPDVDICPEPIVLSTLSGPLDWQQVARVLRPAIDFIWREFGFPGSFNYTQDGLYIRRG
jgi:hypothetical protein